MEAMGCLLPPDIGGPPPPPPPPPLARLRRLRPFRLPPCIKCFLPPPLLLATPLPPGKGTGLGGGLRGPRRDVVRSALRLLGDAGRRKGDLLRGDFGLGVLGRGVRGLGDLGRGDLGRGVRRVGERAILTQPTPHSYPIY